MKHFKQPQPRDCALYSLANLLQDETILNDYKHILDSTGGACIVEQSYIVNDYNPDWFITTMFHTSFDEYRLSTTELFDAFEFDDDENFYPMLIVTHDTQKRHVFAACLYKEHITVIDSLRNSIINLTAQELIHTHVIIELHRIESYTATKQHQSLTFKILTS